jgi:hypothetical protein
MRRIVVALLLLALMAAWWLTAPSRFAPSKLPGHAPDAVAGERVFWAGGCASCHATPVDGKRAKGAAKLLLGGGMELESPYGVFRVPNISPHADGIGGWSMLEFVNAMQHGVSPAGKHYYPSFPYTSYAKAATRDVMDLKAYLDTLPEIAGRSEDHSLSFPWSIRRGIGAWKAGPRTGRRTGALRGMPYVSWPFWWTARGSLVRGRGQPGRQRPHSQHHAGRREHWVLDSQRYRLLPRERVHAGV